VKYDEAAECLNKDRDALPTFYDFPAEHWKHLRTTDEMDKALFVASKTLGTSLKFFCSTALPAFCRSLIAAANARSFFARFSCFGPSLVRRRRRLSSAPTAEPV